MAQELFEKNNINWWRTSPESADLNPMVNLWHELKEYIHSHVKPPTKQELIDGIKAFWRERVDVRKCQKYINHIISKAVPTVDEIQGCVIKFWAVGSVLAVPLPGSQITI